MSEGQNEGQNILFLRKKNI